jgi:hypothetical protein
MARKKGWRWHHVATTRDFGGGELLHTSISSGALRRWTCIKRSSKRNA